jgi:hypothetical protein
MQQSFAIATRQSGVYRRACILCVCRIVHRSTTVRAHLAHVRCAMRLAAPDCCPFNYLRAVGQAMYVCVQWFLVNCLLLIHCAFHAPVCCFHYLWRLVYLGKKINFLKLYALSDSRHTSSSGRGERPVSESRLLKICIDFGGNTNCQRDKSADMWHSRS